MKVISLVSRKGGGGKTTISGHLGVSLPGNVAVLDLDPQGSLADWWNARSADTPIFIQADVRRLQSQLDQLQAASVDYAVIDTPPALVSAIDAAISVADLVLIPIRPSPHDLRGVVATVEMVEKAGKPFIFIINSATSRARLTGEAAIALSQYGKVCPTILHNRVDYAASMIDGRTVGELSNTSRASIEIAELTSYVLKQLRIIGKP